MKKIISILLMISLVLSLGGCQKKVEPQKDTLGMEWEEILQEADGATVNFYGWGGSQQTNTWLDTELSTYLSENYNVTLNRVPMNIEDRKSVV